MRHRLLILAFALFTAMLAAIVFATDTRQPREEIKTARAEVAVLPQPAVHQPLPTGAPGSRAFDDFRESVALVLVGGVLIGLAAAVRRTA